MRKSSEGFLRDSGSGAALTLKQFDGDVAAPNRGGLLAGWLPAASDFLEAEHLLCPRDRFGDVRHAQRDVVPQDLEADGVAGMRIGGLLASSFSNACSRSAT